MSYTKEYTQLLKHSQIATLTETVEGAQEHSFNVGPINISMLPPHVLKRTSERHFSNVQLLKMPSE